MDNFFNKTKCDRCSNDLSKGRIMSWFNEQTICTDCSEREIDKKKKLKNKGINTDKLEGCGYIPK